MKTKTVTKATKTAPVTIDPATLAIQKAENDVVPVVTIKRAEFGGMLKFGEMEVECYALGDGTPLLTTNGILGILGASKERNLTRFVAAIPAEFQPNFGASKLQFRMPQNNAVAVGYPASILIELCRSYTRAFAAGKLHPKQIPLAMRSLLIIEACAVRGIEALVWEATGYEKVKDANLHQRRLLQWLREEAGVWAKMFPDEFYVELARLYRLRVSENGRRPGIFAGFTAEYVYGWLEKQVPGAYRMLREKNPDPTAGTNHHQYLTPEGRRLLAQHLDTLVTLMKVSEGPSDFDAKFASRFKGAGVQITIKFNDGADVQFTVKREGA